MFKHLLKNKKAQNTAEYALLIALVIAGIVAMQQYAQRALQARVRDASQYMAGQTNSLGSSKQYEPYYQSSNYQVQKDSVDKKVLDEGLVASESGNSRIKSGEQKTTYNGSTSGTGDMPTGM